jgi:hypothetical protein
MMIRASEPPTNPWRFVLFDLIGSSILENGIRCPNRDHQIQLVSYDTAMVNMKWKPLNSAQIRAARALLRWSAAELAREAALGLATVKRAELADGETSMTMANDLAVRRALEAAGVELIDENGGGPGVRLRTRPGKRPSRVPRGGAQ